jgi:hypothetical protein
MAQGMASRDKAPRGVRFVVGLDPTNPDKTDPRFVTELQYVELPTPLIAKLNPLVHTGGVTAPYQPDAEPRVRFFYTVAPAGSTTPPAGTIINRRCIIENLTAEQAGLVVPGCTIVMPTFGTWHKIISTPAAVTTGPNAFGLYSREVALEVFPDANMGAGTDIYIYHFVVYRVATPLMGEPTILLPKEICVDLNMSIGPPPNTTTDFDVFFSPSGQLVNAPTGQLFFWVRNYRKVPSMNLPQGPGLIDAFRRGGEQHIVTIRQSGAHGHNQVLWPDANPASPTFGQYTGGLTPYTLARQTLSQ